MTSEEFKNYLKENHETAINRDFVFSSEFKNLYKEAREEYLEFTLKNFAKGYPLDNTLLNVEDENGNENDNEDSFVTVGEMFDKDFKFDESEEFYKELLKKARFEIKRGELFLAKK